MFEQCEGVHDGNLRLVRVLPVVFVLPGVPPPQSRSRYDGGHV